MIVSLCNPDTYLESCQTSKKKINVWQGPEYVSEINPFSQRLRTRKFKISYQILTMALTSFGFQNNMLQENLSVIY